MSANSRRAAVGAVALLAACAAPAPKSPWPLARQPAGSAPNGLPASLPERMGFPVAETLRLGRPASAAEIAALDIDVAPDGAGLPQGGGSVAEGAALYAVRCAQCHGANGEGGPADRLAGGAGSLTTDKPVLTTGSFWPYATTLFDYVRRAMPYDAPGALSADETYALTAFLLAQSGVIAAGTRLDAATLPAVRMPNRDGFESVWPPAEGR